jgi:hypothetical protein
LRQLLRSLFVRRSRGVETVRTIELARPKHQRSFLSGEHMVRRIARENGDGILLARFGVLTRARGQGERDKWE